jgi:hypothetical protein
MEDLGLEIAGYCWEGFEILSSGFKILYSNFGTRQRLESKMEQLSMIKKGLSLSSRIGHSTEMGP